MAKKKTHKKKKTTKKKAVKKTIKPVADNKTLPESEQIIPSTIKEQENKQLRWFFFWVILAFAAFIVPYLYGQSLLHFEYEGLDFDIQDFEQFKIYHSRFPALDGSNINFNIYLREDPRENDVTTKGTFNKFKYGGYVTFSPEFDLCRGEVSRAVVDLGSFMKTGIGVGPIEAGTTDVTTASNLGKQYVDCTTNPDRTVVTLDIGEPQVIQDANNEFCYEITVASCEDVAPIEKFIVQAAIDMRAS